jgi:hypothetical protein
VDDSPSLAVSWDIHIMCNVGGRQRTAGHSRRLLSEAGFEPTIQYELPLNFALLRAGRLGPVRHHFYGDQDV